VPVAFSDRLAAPTLGRRHGVVNVLETRPLQTLLATNP
jgi:hypothetical protein